MTTEDHLAMTPVINTFMFQQRESASTSAFIFISTSWLPPRLFFKIKVTSLHLHTSIFPAPLAWNGGAALFWTLPRWIILRAPSMTVIFHSVLVSRLRFSQLRVCWVSIFIFFCLFPEEKEQTPAEHRLYFYNIFLLISFDLIYKPNTQIFTSSFFFWTTTNREKELLSTDDTKSTLSLSDWQTARIQKAFKEV